ncbi:MAG: hypothetical protein V1647_02670 [Pseudomonadota bacterium]
MSEPLLVANNVLLQGGVKIPNLSVLPGDILWLECENNLHSDIFVSFMLGLLKIRSGTATLSGNNITLPGNHKVISYFNITAHKYMDDVEKMVKLFAHSGGLEFSSAASEFKRILNGIGAGYALSVKSEEIAPATKKIIQTAMSVAMPSLLLLLDEPFTGLDTDGILFLKTELQNLVKDGTAVIIMSELEPPLNSKKLKFSCVVEK